MKDYQISRFCWLEFNMDNLRDNFFSPEKNGGSGCKDYAGYQGKCL